MRATLLLVVLAGLVAVASASSGQKCLASCNLDTIQCLAACPSECPTDAQCMATCYQTCTTVETTCVAECTTSAESIAIEPVAELKLTPLSEPLYQTAFTSFVSKFKRSYAADEFFARYNIFKANYNKIRLHNLGDHSYTLALNEFADLTWEEFYGRMMGLQSLPDVHAERNTDGPHNYVTELASELDWVSQGKVRPVKNQGSCGSCWAFSANGAIEAAWAIAKGKDAVGLSEQQLVDCSGSYGNNACNGGLMSSSFKYVIANGVTEESKYPYKAVKGTCQAFSKDVTLSKYVDTQAGSEAALMAAVNLGPVSVAIQAGSSPFQFYKSGILDDKACGTRLDHGVLLTGYGTENGKDYWRIKNSWGTSWGEAGFVRFVRDKNQCGISQMASYPIV